MTPSFAMLTLSADAAPKTPKCGRRVCAWCTPLRDLGPMPELAAGEVSHGMCPECVASHVLAFDLAKEVA